MQVIVDAGEEQDTTNGGNALPYWGNEAAHRGYLLVIIAPLTLPSERAGRNDFSDSLKELANIAGFGPQRGWHAFPYHRRG